MPCFDDHSFFTIHRLFLGTHTSDDVPNVLMLANVVLPIGTTNFEVDGKYENYVIPNVEITQNICVDGEVNKAWCMPQNPTIIGGKTSDCEVYVFDTLKQAEKK